MYANLLAYDRSHAAAWAAYVFIYLLASYELNDPSFGFRVDLNVPLSGAQR